MTRLLLIGVLLLPASSLVGCGGGGGEAKTPETYAPKPPPEQTEGKKALDPVQSD